MTAISARVDKTGRCPDGSVKMLLVVPPECEQAALHYQRGATVGMALLQADYGQQAKALRQSGFFRSPATWKAIGSDDAYQAWCRTQACAVTGSFDWDGQKGEGRCVYAHVRRAATSGTGIKPEYSGIPLIDAAHQMQHQNGEWAVCQKYRVRGVSSPEKAKAWFDKQAIEYIQRWAWETLKAQLGYSSWKQVPPEVLNQWATQHDLASLLPKVYRDAVQ